MTVNATNELHYILNHWCRQSLPPVTAPKHFILYFAIIPTPRLFNYPLLHAPTQGSHQHYHSFLSLHLFTYPTSFILPPLHFFTFFYLLSQPLYIYTNHFSLYPLPIHPFFVPSTSPTVTTPVVPNRRLAGTRSVLDQTVHCYHSNVPNRKPIKLCFVPYPQLATAYS